jgi:hypothetical protein
VKLFPAVLFPAFYERGSWKMTLAFVGTILVTYLPYLSVGPLGVLGFLPGYVNERGMMSGEQFFLLTVARHLFSANLPASTYLIFTIVVLGVLSLWMMRAQRSDEINYFRNCLIMASAFIVLLAPHFAWYFTWLVLFLCFIPSVPVFYLTAASFLLYLTWINDTPDRVFTLKTLIYAPFLILGILVIWSRRQSIIHLEK